MPTNDRHTEVTGSMIDGGAGGIRVGRNLKVTSTVSIAADALTERDLQLVQAVLDTARPTDPTMPPELAAALHQLAEEIAAEPTRRSRSRVRAALEQVAIHAGTAGAVFAAAELALDALS